jgi:hypothetical protein
MVFIGGYEMPRLACDNECCSAPATWGVQCTEPYSALLYACNDHVVEMLRPGKNSLVTPLAQPTAAIIVAESYMPPVYRLLDPKAA